MNRRAGPRILLTGCALLVLSGCATEVGHRDAGVPFGRSQGASSAVVFNTDEMVAPLPGWEYGRLDYAYAPRVQRPISGMDSWPTASRPSLANTRYLTLPRANGQYLYVLPARRYPR